LKLTLRQANESFLLKREIEEKNRNLEQALKELRVLDQAKSRFLALVSHELNTPLTVLNSFVELISEQKEELSAEFSKAFSSIEGASHRLSDIVREVVEYVRLESNPQIHKSPTDLSALLKEVVTQLQEKARTKKVTLQFLASEKVVLELDQEKIRVGLKGLLEDAISRSPENSPVEIKLTEAGGSVTLLVTRSGLPMTEEALKAFETGQSLMNHHQNLALGLAICRTVLERHSAKMEIVNSVGQSTLSIELKR
ncbi:MAG: sensor histidine kinase, partial [Deltaproteobacteria bacterium]